MQHKLSKEILSSTCYFYIDERGNRSLRGVKGPKKKVERLTKKMEDILQNFT